MNIEDDWTDEDQAQYIYELNNRLETIFCEFCKKTNQIKKIEYETSAPEGWESQHYATYSNDSPVAVSFICNNCLSSGKFLPTY